MIIGSLLFWPRLFILGFAIFSWDLLIDAFSGWVVWVAGFFVLPWTTITYMMMWGIYSDRVYGVEWVFVGSRCCWTCSPGGRRCASSRSASSAA